MLDSNHAVVSVGETFLARTWGRIPIVVRAVIAGFVVLVAGNFLPQGLIAANIRSPAVPWSAAAIAVYLWLYWLYVQGRGWPRSTTTARRRGLRAVPLSPRVWRWSFAAGGLRDLGLSDRFHTPRNNPPRRTGHSGRHLAVAFNAWQFGVRSTFIGGSE